MDRRGDYSQFVLAGVIWMLGWCMVLLAALIWLPVRAIGILYAVWLAAVAILYPLCRWYAGVKRRRPHSWLRFI